MSRLVPVPDDHLGEDRLVDIALGDPASAPELEHLDGCDVCRGGLDALARTMSVTRGSAGTTLVPPPPHLWSSIRAEALDEQDAPAVRSLRRGAGRGGAGRRPALAWLAAACVAGVLVGVGGTVVADRLGQPEQRTIASAELDTLDTGERRGSAAVEQRDGRVSLQVSASDVAVSDGYAEVWLINRDGKRMVSVGVLDAADGTESFPITQSLLDEGYVIVDISHEAFDDRPEHSGDSLVRGPLAEEA